MFHVTISRPSAD